MENDTISRQAAIDAILGQPPEVHYPSWYAEQIKALPSAQPEITHEQAIDHLEKSGWMQSHDKQMYEMGLKEQLANDSGSYDALLPSTQPEIIRCKDCKWWKKQKYSLQGRCELLQIYPTGAWYCGTAQRRGGQNESD